MNSKNVTSEGALYELVSRGNKDVYFFSDDPGTAYLYNNRYNPQPPVIYELRRLPPIQAAEFGRAIEFEFEIAGDVVVEPTLLIDLPSWLPTTQAVLNPRSSITDSNGVTYGYTKGIAYFLFEKIQFYQDRILLQEWSGDGLYATTRSRGSLNSAFLENAVTGVHNGSPLSIQRAATPGLLRLSLPLIGCQDLDDGGFPRVVSNQQNFRIRCFLRKLEDLVEASDGQEFPKPWGRTDFRIQTTQGGPLTTFSTVERYLMASPSVRLETRHIYTDKDTQDALRSTKLIIPFERQYNNVFTQSANDYAPLKRNGTAVVQRRLDAEHPVSRMVLTFRSIAFLRANQRWRNAADVSGGQSYNFFNLIIAGRDRESLWDSLVWQELEQHAKEERDSGDTISFVNWTLGDIQGRRAPFARQPEGSVNFSTADRPTLLIDLAQIQNDPLTGSPNTQLNVYIDSWAAQQFEKGRTFLVFGN